MVECYFGGICVSGLCYCSHLDICSEPEVEPDPVCGSDGVTYLNSCELKLTQCETKKSISVQYNGLCNINNRYDCDSKGERPCAGVGEVCDSGICKCGTCDNIKPAAVCGTDGNTYQSRCHLDRRRCQESIHQLEVDHDGICKECLPLYWDGSATNNNRYCDRNCNCPDQIAPVCHIATLRTFKNECLAKCRIDDSSYDSSDIIDGTCKEKFERELRSECPECDNRECKFIGTSRHCHCKICEDEYEPVCGTDGKTYESLCILERTNCEYSDQNSQNNILSYSGGVNVELLHRGKCDLPSSQGFGSSSCERCEFGGRCDDNGRCQCFNCDSSLIHPVCGSDGKSYRNQCLLKLQECIEQIQINVTHMQRCDAKECTSVHKSNCPIYTQCWNGVCQCPSCDYDRDNDDQGVCGSDGENYSSRCELRERACNQNLEIFEIPCEDDVIVEGSGYDDCLFGGIDASGVGYGAYSDDEDDNEGDTCQCDWHCPEGGNAIVAEGEIYENLCFLYRDGMCGAQRMIDPEYSICSCDGVGVIDPDFCSAGKCLCKPRFIGDQCQSCEANYYVAGGNCNPCSCSTQGSVGPSCSANGICTCKPGYSGDKCDNHQCKNQSCWPVRHF